MRIVIVLDGKRCRNLFKLRIILYSLCYLVAGFDGSIVFQYIQNKALVDSLTHRVMVECIVCAISFHHSECLQRFGLRSSRKSIEIQILMLTLRQQRFSHHIHAVFQFLFGLFLPCSHLAQCFVCVSKCLFQFLCTLSALTAVSLVYYNGKVLLCMSVKLLINQRESMNSCNDDALFIVDGIL